MTNLSDIARKATREHDVTISVQEMTSCEGKQIFLAKFVYRPNCFTFGDTPEKAIAALLTHYPVEN